MEYIAAEILKFVENVVRNKTITIRGGVLPNTQVVLSPMTTLDSSLLNLFTIFYYFEVSEIALFCLNKNLILLYTNAETK